MMSVAQSQELKAKLQTKGKVRPHKMVSKKMPDGSTAALTLKSPPQNFISIRHTGPTPFGGPGPP